MLKKFLCICVGAMLAFGASAQVAVQSDYNYPNSNKKSANVSAAKESKGAAFAWKYGVKAGVNISSMSNDMAFDPGFSTGIGFRVGGMLNLRWGKRTVSSLPGTGWFGLQPELLFSNETIGSDGGDVKLNYISLPIMLKLYPTTALSIEVGPEFNYLISASPESLAADGAEVKVEDCKGLAVGVGAGLAYEFKMGLVVGARYSYNFTDMAKNLKWKNNNIQVTVGWLF